jgi:hypothetical protein
MPGASLQLALYGAQDIYLTGNPQITFFKIVYRRHTNFSMESIELPYNQTITLGNQYTFNLERKGDLLGSIFLHIKVDPSGIYDTYYGFQLIDYVELLIGSQSIDKQYGEWMSIWCDLTHPYDKAQMLDDMISNFNNIIIIPLQFWFCRNPGLAIPIMALNYHNIQLNIKFRKSSEFPYPLTFTYFKIFADYYYLDTDERRRFANKSHEYLIEQVQQFESNTIDSSKLRDFFEFSFQHPVKELIWVVYDYSGNYYYINNYEEVGTALLQLNGQERLSRREGYYFTRQQRYQYHTGSGAYTGPRYIHVYSFALKPEEYQPSGSCNFSRVDNATLDVTFLTNNFKLLTSGYRVIRMYAPNYNVLRITNGMAGLAYTS